MSLINNKQRNKNNIFGFKVGLTFIISFGVFMQNGIYCGHFPPLWVDGIIMLSTFRGLQSVHVVRGNKTHNRTNRTLESSNLSLRYTIQLSRVDVFFAASFFVLNRLFLSKDVI